MSDKDIKNTGLRGVTVASTKISDVQGNAGKLIYRGYLVQDLAAKASYEETAYLLLKEKLPNPEELKIFKSELAGERYIPDSVIAALKTRPVNSMPMDILQAGISMLANHDPDIHNLNKEASMRSAVRLISKTAVIVAAWQQIRNGKEPISALPDLDHGANFLYMLTGNKPTREIGRFMDAALVLHAEHSFNASTFAAREVGSTRAHMYAATSAAVGSLSGELHGSANVKVMEMLLKIGDINQVEAYVEAELAAGKKTDGARPRRLSYRRSQKLCSGTYGKGNGRDRRGNQMV